MKQLALIAFILTAFTATTFGQKGKDKGGEKGYTQTKSGILYKFVKQNPKAEKPKDGNVLFLNLKVHTENPDSTIFSSIDVQQQEGTPYFEALGKPQYAGDYAEILAMMHVGDSAIAKVDVDTIFKNIFHSDTIPPFLKHGSKIVFEMGLIKIMVKDSFDIYRAKLQQQKLDTAFAIESTNITEFLAINNITATPLPSGLYYMESKKGDGRHAETGLMATVKYTGMFLDGTVFDSNEGMEMREIPVNGKMVIPGFDEAVALMSEGTEATVIVPFKLAYGIQGYPGAIPPFTTLLFKLELLKLREDTTNK